MKKIVLIILFFTIGFLILPTQVLAWLDCPYGKVNEPYPGSCQLYLDTDNNQTCDHSEPTPETSKETGIIVQEEKKGDSGQQLYFYLVFLPLAVYFIHWYLVNKTTLSKKFKWLNKISFRYFWNLVLLLSFLPTAISSILFILGVRSVFLLSLHNQLGTIFVVVGLLHFFARFQYFLRKP